MKIVKTAALAAMIVLAASACATTKSSNTTAPPPVASASSVADLSAFQALVDKYTAPVTWQGPTDAAKAPTGKKVGILSCTFALEGCRLPSQGAEAAAKKLGWATTLVVSNDPSQFNGALKSLLVGKPDVVFMTGIGKSLIGDALKAASAQGTLIVSMIENNPVGDGISADLTPDGVAVGKALAAKMIVDSKGTLKLLDMHDGEFGFAVEIENSLLDTVKSCSSCEVTKTVNFTASEIGTSVPKSVVTALQSNPSINTVFLPYDPIVTAVLPVMINAGLGSKTTYSQLGTSDALNYLRAGTTLKGDVATPEGWIGWASVDVAIRLMNKQPAVAENLPIKVLTPQNAPPVGSPFTGTSDGVDFQSKYLALWGVTG